MEIKSDSLIKALFLIILLHTAASMTVSHIWKESLSEANLIYNDGIVFTLQTPNAVRCARICQTYPTCRDVTYTGTAEECRGYDGLSHDYVSHLDTQMWKSVCRLPGYTYDPELGVCIRLYTTAQTWFEAQQACSNDTAYLLILDTKAKMWATKFGAHKDSFLVSNGWWVGGYDYDSGPSDDYRWSNGNSIPVPTSDLWFPSQPDTQSERCVNLYLYLIGLFDGDCQNQLYYACQETI